MLASNLLTVSVAVDAQKFPRIICLYQSLISSLPDYQIQFEVLLFGVSSVDTVDTSESGSAVNIFHRETGVIPIVHARNYCQSHLQNILESKGGLGMLLDDDLVWTLSQLEFESLLKSLREQACDMALLGLSGDPPVPKEYLRASQLLDYFYFLSHSGKASHAVEEYLKGFEPGNEMPMHAHHDAYAFTHHGFFAFHFDDQGSCIYSRLLAGKKTSRSPHTVSDIQRCSGRSRGGATLILNHEVLDIPNTSVVLDGRVSRRSDMVMATEASRRGFRLFQTPAVLNHKRSINFDSDCPDKLISDILGYAYVESLLSGEPIQGFAKERTELTRVIVTETSRMLTMCESHASLPEVEKIRTMLAGNEQVFLALDKFDAALINQSVLPGSRYPANRDPATNLCSADAKVFYGN